MRYTSQQLIHYIHSQGHSDQEIADVVECSRETITRVRLGKPGYQGLGINGKLIEVVRALQQEQKPQPQPQVATSKPYSHVATSVQPGPQVRSTTLEQAYCPSCPFRALVPPGMSGQQLTQWLKDHSCIAKQRRQCPV